MRILIILVALVGISETASGQAVPLASSEGLERNNREYLFKVRLTINEPACICSLSFDGSNRGLDFGEVQIPSTGEIEKTISPSDPEAVRLLGIHRNCDGAIGYGASVEPEFQFQGPGVFFEKLDDHSISAAGDTRTLRASVGATVTIQSTAVPDEDGVEEGRITVLLTCG